MDTWKYHTPVDHLSDEISGLEITIKIWVPVPIYGFPDRYPSLRLSVGLTIPGFLCIGNPGPRIGFSSPFLGVPDIWKPSNVEPYNLHTYSTNITEITSEIKPITIVNSNNFLTLVNKQLSLTHLSYINSNFYGGSDENIRTLYWWNRLKCFDHI